MNNSALQGENADDSDAADLLACLEAEECSNQESYSHMLASRKREHSAAAGLFESFYSFQSHYLHLDVISALDPSRHYGLKSAEIQSCRVSDTSRPHVPLSNSPHTSITAVGLAIMTWFLRTLPNPLLLLRRIRGWVFWNL